MKNDKVKIWFSKPDLQIQSGEFPSKSNILFVTGLSGSGKSFLAKELAEKHSAIIFQPEWLIHSKHAPKAFKEFIQDFQNKYPETIPYIQNKWNNCKFEDDNDILTKYINLFLKEFLETTDQTKNYIIEGLQLFTLIDFKLIKDYPFIIKRTSSIKALNQRLKRDLQKRKSFKDKTKYFFKALKQSKLYQFKHRKKLNAFISKLTKENAA